MSTHFAVDEAYCQGCGRADDDDANPYAGAGVLVAAGGGGGAGGADAENGAIEALDAMLARAAAP